MNKSKYTISVLAFLLLVTSLWAADIDQILNRRKQAAKLPKSDTVILYHGTVFTISQDGRMDRQEHIVRYLRNLNAWDEFGDPHIAFRSSRQELDVQISRVHTTDGRKVDTTPNGFNLIVPFGLDRAPDFTDYRQMVVTHLGIEHDAVTELKYFIRDLDPFYPWAWGEVLFGTHEPTLEREVIVQVPRDAGLTIKSENGAPEGASVISLEREVISWRMTDLPSYDFAETGDKTRRCLPRISFSTCPDWMTFTGEINKRFTEAMTHGSEFNSAVSKFQELNDDRMKIDSVVAFISDRIALKQFHDMGMLLNFRSADQIYATGYGSPADLAVIYAAGLQTVGLNPRLYLFSTKNLPVPGVTGDEAFSLFMETSSKKLRVNPKNGSVKYIHPDGMDWLGIIPAEEPRSATRSSYQDNHMLIDMEIKFKEDGSADGSIFVKSFGQSSLVNLAMEDGVEKVIEHFTSDLYVEPEIDAAVAQHLEGEKVEAKANLKFEPFEETVEGLLVLRMPWAPGDFHGILPHGLELYQADRDVPVFLEHSGTVAVNVKIHLPDNYSIELVPSSLNLSGKGITAGRSVTQEGGTITFSEEVTFTLPEIPVESWDEWRALLQKASKANNRTLLINTNSKEQS